MEKQTKLVECGSTVFIYDFKKRPDIKNLYFERNNPTGELTQLKRLILTNFVDGRYLATFTLKMLWPSSRMKQFLLVILKHFVPQIW